MRTLKLWSLFIRERFPLLKHLLLISSLFGANAFVITCAFPAKIPYLGFLVVFLAYFRLRIFDEVKDYETDLQMNPHRPLARGLITVQEAKKFAFSLLFFELLLSYMISSAALIAALCYSAYSLLMYKEFFMRNWLRSKLATYALTHTIVSSLIALFIFSVVTGHYFWEAPFTFYLFALANWMIFNVFEFGRKTFSKDEEQPGVDSYSKNFGSWGAAICVLFMAAVAEVIALFLSIHLAWPLSIPLSLVLLFFILFSAGIFYGQSNSSSWSVSFRRASSAFILFYNLIISLGFLLC